MSSLSIDDLNQRLLSLDLMDMAKIQNVESSFGLNMFTAEQFLQQAQRYGYLTKYQVERLLSGESTGYYYGDYRIQYLIGAGSFARVFRCVHKDTGKVVAVKVLRARFRDDQTAINEFIREGEMGMELRHPNIAAVYEAVEDRGDHYMVMEFVEGGTLREMLNAQKNGKLDPRRATRIAYDVCSALDYAQKRGYQHRDMKLSNIMVASSGRAVLLDFGLLTDESSDFKTQRAIEYAALERSTHVRRDDRRSDLYFLGSVYYQALTGVAPLGEIKERARRLDASRFKNVKPIREVSREVPRFVAAVVDKSMKFHPDERYQAPEYMLQDLEKVMKRIERGDADDEQEVVVSSQPAVERVVTTKSIMIVEANPALQETFRESFRNAGFRPLVISSVQLALTRLEDFQVDAVLFNAQTLGANALIAFNQLLDSPFTRDLSAILLLNEDQVKWGAKAKRSKKRLAVGMPIPMKRLLQVVDMLTRKEEPTPEPATAPKAETAVAAPKPEQVAAPAASTAPAASPASEEASKDAGSSKKAEPEFEDDFPTDAYDAALEDAFDKFTMKARSTPDTRAVPQEPVVSDVDEYDDYSSYLDEEEDQDE